MSISTKRPAMRALLCGCACLSLSACANGLDFDLRSGLGNKFGTSSAAAKSNTSATQNRPRPDANGVITYPNYQVAVARRGDTVASVAARVGADAADLARYNGLTPQTLLRRGEVVALRSRISSSPAQGTAGAVDISALAQGAIDSSPVTTTALPASASANAGPEPVRHQVGRGETAFTIARLYNVSVRSLADWNGLDREFSVREGQFLLIPVAQNQAVSSAPLAATTHPGVGSPTPTPPSSTKPLPDEKTQAAATPVADTPPAPKLKTTAAPKTGQMAYPVSGPIIREYAKGKNDGIDIGAKAGTAVTAAANGTVAAITENTDNLPIIVVKHPNNLLTVYANVDGLRVKKGDPVTRGQKIASVRGDSSDFLHFEVRKGFDSVDPLPYLR